MTAVPPTPADAAADTADTADTVAAVPGVGRSSLVLGVATLASRITGFGKATAIAAAIGLGPVADVYSVATNVPTAVYELLLGGVLSAVIVPMMVRAQKDPDGGVGHTDRLLSLALVAFGVVAAAAVLAAPLVARIYLGSATAAQADLTTDISRLTLVTIAFLGLSALLSAFLNARSEFAVTGWAPVVNNLVVIALAGVLILVGRDLAVGSITRLETFLLGVTFPAGIAAQTVVLWVALRRAGYRFRWRWDPRGAGVGELRRLAGWTLLLIATSMVGSIVLANVLSANAERGGPGNAVHTNAYLLFVLPHAVAAVSVITALLPRMSRAAAAEAPAELTGLLSLGIRLSSTVLVAGSAAFVALGVPLAVVVYGYGRGAADPDLLRAVGYAVVAAGIGLVPFAVSQLQVYAFYAMQDTRTPALLNFASVGARIVVFVLALVLLPAQWVVVGTMTANTLAYTITVVLTGWLLRRRLGRLDTTRILRTLSRLAVAGVVAGAIAWAIGYGAQAWLGTGLAGSWLAVTAGGTALVAAYIAGAIFLRVEEVTEIGGTLRRRLPARFR